MAIPSIVVSRPGFYLRSVSPPGAPTSVVATKGNGEASVAFTAPVDDGGSAILSYTVTASPGVATATGASSPLVVPGLVNGTAYTFTVTATNANGTGLPSAASAAVTPSTVPGAPTALVGTPGNGEVSVAFTAPASNGGDAITGYTVTSSPGGFTATGASSPLVVSGLSNGTAYTFTAVATNSNGDGAASSASSAATPATVPGAPTIGTATAGVAQASVTFSAPGSNGGSAITGYTVTSSPGGFTATGASSPLVVTGLANNTAYTFTVTATNAIGTGSASSASGSVTTATVPGAPTIGTATAGIGSVSVAFTAPGSNGGSAITSYTATSSPGGFTASGASSPLVVSGLSNGTAYTFTVTATNAVGTGSASSASGSATPTGIFNLAARTGTGATAAVTGAGFAPDIHLGKSRGTAAWSLQTRMRGAGELLRTNVTTNEVTDSASLTSFDSDGVSLGADGTNGLVNASTVDYMDYFWKKAVGAIGSAQYTGNGTAGRTISHDLGVAPELLIGKSRGQVGGWWCTPVAKASVFRLEATSAQDTSYAKYVYGNDSAYVAPTSTHFTIASGNEANGTSWTYEVLLFATLAGVSKVGYYTGTGAAGLQVNCGFAAGARFVMIRRLDVGTDAVVFDSVRGLGSGNDPVMSLNSTSGDYSGADYLAAYSGGFELAGANYNVSGGTYLYLAFA